MLKKIDPKNQERYKKLLLEIIEKHLPSCKVYLFGSRATGDAQPGSDIDIAIDAEKKIDRKILGQIKEDIEESTIPLFVDVIDLHDELVAEDFKQFIAKEMIIWKT